MIVTVTLNPAADKFYRVDRLSVGTVNRIGSVIETAGGKGLNVARVIRQWGGEVLCLGFAGGRNGAFLRQRLAEEALPEALTQTAGETRTCIHLREESGGRHTELLEPGEPVTPEERERFETRFRRSLKQADVAVLSGSLGAGLPVDYYGKLVAWCREEGVRSVLDTSGEPLRAGLREKPDLVKPNEEELAALLGRRPRPEERAQALERLRRQGAGRTVLSLGGEGCLYLGPEGLYRTVPAPIHPVNTVGCGDSLVAGLALALERGLAPEEGLRLATALSEANALTEETGAYRREDLERLWDGIQVNRL